MTGESEPIPLRVRCFPTATAGLVRTVWFGSWNHEIAEGYDV